MTGALPHPQHQHTVQLGVVLETSQAVASHVQGGGRGGGEGEVGTGSGNGMGERWEVGAVGGGGGVEGGEGNVEVVRVGGLHDSALHSFPHTREEGRGDTREEGRGGGGGWRREGGR